MSSLRLQERPTKTLRLSTGQAIVDALVRNGVDTIFGIPGVHTYALFEALAERRREICFVGARHEQGAAYMAFGYARSSDKVGVFTCVPGPGLLNAGAALATAYAANAPVLCLTGEIPAAEIGQGHGILHELRDQLGILERLTKYAAHVDRPAAAHGIVNDAFVGMRSNRPGPAAVQCPWDTLGERGEVSPIAPFLSDRAPQPNPDHVAAAAKVIAAARNPMIMVGSGALGARAEIRHLAELLQAPVTAYRSGRGIVGEDLAFGLNFAAAHELWPNCDVLIAIGTRMELPFLRWRNIPAGLKIVRIDIDAAEMRRRDVHVGIVADAVAATSALNDALREKIGVRPSRERELAACKERARRKYQTVQPQVDYLDVIRQVLPRDGFFVEEICQVGFTARFAFPVFEPRTYVSCGYQDNLGFGFMTALGVKMAHPQKPVVSINGDGGFMFGVQELATAVQQRLGVVAIVFNNQAFGNVLRDEQQQAYELGARLVNPDFVRLAQSFGAHAERVSTPECLRQALARALERDAPALIEVPLETGCETSPWPFLNP